MENLAPSHGIVERASARAIAAETERKQVAGGGVSLTNGGFCRYTSRMKPRHKDSLSTGYSTDRMLSSWQTLSAHQPRLFDIYATKSEWWCLQYGRSSHWFLLAFVAEFLHRMNNAEL